MVKQILLIDDDKDELELFEFCLRKLGEPYQCEYAASGFDALERLKTLQPNYIFVDFNMPRMNGLEFLEQLKSYERLSGIPIFLYSTHIDKDMKKRALQQGMADCIVKPPQLDQLVTTLKRILLPQPGQAVY
jgi:CheY-like chemotaxis protein